MGLVSDYGTCVERCLCNSSSYTYNDRKSANSSQKIGYGSGCLLLRCAHVSGWWCLQRVSAQQTST